MSWSRCSATTRVRPGMASLRARAAGKERFGNPRRGVLRQATPTVTQPAGAGGVTATFGTARRYVSAGSAPKPGILAGSDISRSHRAFEGHRVRRATDLLTVVQL